MTQHVYDNAFAADNVYGHAFELLRRHGSGDGVHLDVGCSFGRIAEALAGLPGLTYVGVDADEVGLSSLRARGFEVHRHALGDAAADAARLEAILGGRRLRSISIIDTLEHVPHPEIVLAALRTLAKAHGVPVVVSVPNVAHRDVGFKLAFGRWDYTPAGLLDETHLRFFTDESLGRMTRAVGLRQVGADDVVWDTSDQRFPADHAALADASALRGFLLQVRGEDPMARVNQLVRAYLPSAPSGESFSVQPEGAPRPLLTAVVRTQGRREGTLREVLLSMSAQTVTDFEILVVAHKVEPAARARLDAQIAAQLPWLRDRIRVVTVDHGNRTTPLNVGFAEARGRYIAILDDDDVPFANWVEAFAELARQYPGRVLRAVAARQEFDEVHTVHGGGKAVRATSGMHMDYPPSFDLVRHLESNHTPPIALAFPRSAFHDFGIRFDETLSTTEDWDFLLRVVLLAGVACTEEITGIYRWWRSAESSRTEHDEREWDENRERIYRKLDALWLLLPPGSAAQLRAPGRGASLPRVHKDLMEELSSVAWRATAPIRWAAAPLGSATKVKLDDVPYLTEYQAARELENLRRSFSMRLASTVKRTASLLLPPKTK